MTKKEPCIVCIIQPSGSCAYCGKVGTMPRWIYKTKGAAALQCLINGHTLCSMACRKPGCQITSGHCRDCGSTFKTSLRGEVVTIRDFGCDDQWAE